MTDRQKKNLKSYCSEPLEQIENFKAAEADNFAGWCIHHRLEIQPDGTRVSMQELKSKGLYYSRPASELVFMREHDHRSMHKAGANHHLFGKHHSAEARLKMSAARKGNHNVKGKHWWNDGVSCKLAKECPGEGWTRGRFIL